VIDAHCHLYSNKYDSDLDLVIQRARQRLEAVVISAVDLDSLHKSLAIRRRYPDFIHVTAGVHPRKSAALEDEELRRWWRITGDVAGEIVAVGEVGPDFHHVGDPRLRARQLRVLESALDHAEALGLPLVIHARRAEEPALKVVSRSQVPVLFHCFSGSKQAARGIVAHGFYVSFSALLLTAAGLQEIAREIPAELILTETDSPALCPLRDRTRNEPAFVEMVVSCLAKLLQYQPTQMAALTAANARRFYRLAARSSP
jgi:TatD DNase family protein